MGGTQSLGIRLLADLRAIFGEREHLLTSEILGTLNEMVESPWGDLHGKPLDAHSLAWRLGKFGVRPHQVRVGMTTAKGYSRVDLHDPWRRYLPANVSDNDVLTLQRVRGEEGVDAAPGQVPSRGVNCVELSQRR